MDESEKKYVKQFNEKEIKAYDIAKKKLDSSFDLKKSIGYIKMLKASKNR